MELSCNLISRDQWGAVPARSTEPLTLPVTKVLYSAENMFDPCMTQEECMRGVKAIQKHYMDKGLDDMPYNFVIGNDGNVYEGRGWGNKPGPDIQKNDAFKDQTIDIGVICGWEEVTPDNMDMVRDAFRAAQEFVDYGVQEKTISETFEFEGFSDDVEPTIPVEQEQPKLKTM